MTCPHGMPTPASCIDCMEEGNLPAQTTVREQTDYTFLANYHGQCPGCDLPIVAGSSMVAKTTSDRYFHVRCAP